MFFFFLVIRLPPRSTRTDTLFPYTTLFRSPVDIEIGDGGRRRGQALVLQYPVPTEKRCRGRGGRGSWAVAGAASLVAPHHSIAADGRDRKSTRLNSSH